MAWSVPAKSVVVSSKSCKAWAGKYWYAIHPGTQLKAVISSASNRSLSNVT
ncbi:hypothetical protein D3C86_2181030 [compost metagenome]